MLWKYCSLLPVFLLLFSACKNGETELDAVFQQAEKVMETCPDSALSLLENMDTTRIKTPESLATYGLLLVGARYENKLPISPYDSLIRFSVHYFDRSNNRISAAKALYYNGLLKSEKSEPEKAIASYLEAISQLKSTQEYDLSGRIYNELGNIFWRQLLFDRAIDSHKEALALARKSTNPVLLCKTLRYIGRDYLFVNNADSTLFYLNEALDLSQQIDDDELLSAIYNNLCFLYQKNSDYQKALEYNEKATQLITDSINIYKNYVARGGIYLSLHEIDSAKYYLYKVMASPDMDTKASLYSELSKLEKMENNDLESTHYQNKYWTVVDSIYKRNRTIEIGETDYKHTISLQLEEEKDKFWNRTILSSLVLISGLLLFLLFYRQKNKRRQKQIRTLKEDIQEKNRKIDDLTKQTDANKQPHPHVLLIDRTGTLCAKHFSKTKFFLAKRQLISELSAQNGVLKYEDQKVLFESIDKVFEDYVQLLKITCPEMTADECYLCCLIKLKLSPAECAVCRAVTTNAIWVQKSRLKVKMSGTSLNESLFNLIFLNYK